MIPTFTINSASTLLERDRRTIGKALRRVEPDKVERGQKRYRLRTILDALDELPGSNAGHRESVGPVVHHDWLNPANWRDSHIRESIIEYNDAFTEMQTIEGLEQRRAFAVKKLGPLVHFHAVNFRDWETDNPAPGRFWNDQFSVSCRVESLWTQQREAVQAACEWSYEEFWEFFVTPFDDAEEE